MNNRRIDRHAEKMKTEWSAIKNKLISSLPNSRNGRKTRRKSEIVQLLGKWLTYVGIPQKKSQGV